MSEAPPTDVNPQILQAVDTTTQYALGLKKMDGQSADLKAFSAGAAIAYDKAVQAAALATQDAADYERNVLSISAAVQGKALAMILAEGEVNPTSGPVAAWVLAVVGSLVAPVSAGLAASTVTLAVKEFFPRT